MTDRLHFHFSLSCIGEGNGKPLQCSCLENPRDGGAWWAAVYGVSQSRTRLKWLSSSSSSDTCAVFFQVFTADKIALVNIKGNAQQRLVLIVQINFERRSTLQNPHLQIYLSKFSIFSFLAFCSFIISILVSIAIYFNQFSSVTQLCTTLSNPMDGSTPGFPVHHQLPELTQTHVHRIGDAIQPSHPLSSPSPPVFNLLQYQGLFQ